MNIMRLSWSSYQTQDNLEKEAETIRDMGHSYLRPRESGPRPGKLNTYDTIIINSKFDVDEVFLNHWNRDGHLLTASSGYNHIDIEACERYGVTVGRIPQCRAGNVRDYVIAALRLFRQDLHRTGHPARSTFWDRPAANENIRDFDDLTLGILGYGVIGQLLAEELAGSYAGTILASDPLKREAIESSSAVESVGVDTLFERSNILTLHADLNDSTRGIIGSQVIETMPDPSFLINTARGAMVNVQAVRTALTEGDLAGAMLDVLPEEPPENPDTLRDEGLFVTPHSAGFGPNLLDALIEEIAENIRSIDETGSPLHPVRTRSDDEGDQLKAQRDALD